MFVYISATLLLLLLLLLLLFDYYHNIILQCIYRSVHKYLTVKKLKCIRNLYVQMDNTNSNKSIELLNGLAALVLLNICHKVKVSYLTVGHTHNDDDGAIGIAGNHMCNEDIQSISRFEELIKESFENFGSSNTFVEPIIGISDFGKITSHSNASNPYDINGNTIANILR